MIIIILLTRINQFCSDVFNTVETVQVVTVLFT